VQQIPTVVKPSYVITSVDHALRLVQMLRDNGSVGLTQAATELGVSPSTVHRMMAMLVYRGFALQDLDRRYVAGPAMSVPPVAIPWANELRSVCRPHLELLASRVEETVNLMVRVGSKVRFLDSVEGHMALRIGDRTGSVLDAHQASGGKALLAEADPQTLDRLFRSKSAQLAGAEMSDAQFARFQRELAGFRAQGYAVNHEESEVGIHAVGMALHDPSGWAFAAISVAAPTFRSERIFSKHAIAIIDASRREMEADIEAAGLAETFQR